MRRLFAYVDGFNLYHGMRDSQWKRFYWLNLRHLAEWFLPADAELLTLKYFTAMVVPPAGDQDKLKRQERYIDALRTLPNTEIVLGYYMPITRKCPLCHRKYSDFAEKSTDVSIAIQMLSDAHKGNYDDLMLISGDGDLKDALVVIHRDFPDKSIVVIFPPNRSCKEFKRLEAKGTCKCLNVTQTELRSSQFPDPVLGIHGYPLKRPTLWV